MNPYNLRSVLTTRFDLGELQTLAFDLGVDFDALPGDGKAAKARELLAHLERRGEVRSLVAWLRSNR